MKNRSIVPTAILFLLTNLIAEAEKTPGPILPQNFLVKTYNDLGFRYYSQIWPKDKVHNILFSPAALGRALGLIEAGASGREKETIKALFAPSLESGKDTAANHGILWSWVEKEPLGIGQAQTMWFNKAFDIKRSFTAAARDSFRAQIQGVDYSKTSSLDRINQWVGKSAKSQTANALKSAQLSGSGVLLDAVAAPAAWERPFDPLATRPKIFYLSNGDKVPCSMMSRNGRYAYYKGDSLQMAALPFADGKSTLYLMLPDEFILDNFAGEFSVRNLELWKKGLKKKSGWLIVPRGVIENSVDFQDFWSRLELAFLFDPGLAELDGLSALKPNRRFYLGGVRQFVRLELTEGGGKKQIVNKPPEPTEGGADAAFTFLADHPFLFVVQDNVTGLIWLMGHFAKPG